MMAAENIYEATNGLKHDYELHLHLWIRHAQRSKPCSLVQLAAKGTKSMSSRQQHNEECD